MKQHKYNELKGWIAKVENNPAFKSSVSKLGNIDPQALFSKMTAHEMQAVLSLVVGVYSQAYAESREFNRTLKIGYEPKSRENRLAFRVIKGGVA